jgi:hypothetical protein
MAITPSVKLFAENKYKESLNWVVSSTVNISNVPVSNVKTNNVDSCDTSAMRHGPWAVTGYGMDARASIPSRDTDLFSASRFKTSSGAHSASNPVDVGGPLLPGKAKCIPCTS